MAYDWNWFFGPNSVIGKLFGAKKPAPTPVPLPPVPTVRAVGVVVFGSNGPLVGATAILDDVQPHTFPATDVNGYAVVNEVPLSLGASQLTITANDYAPYSVHVDVPNHGVDFVIGGPAGLNQIALPGLTALVHARKGVVKTSGRNFVDGDGFFYPLGGTLMWALRGWKFERDRIKANLQYLAKFKFDYVRILGHVCWPGNDIDARWPDYEQILGEFLDYAYSIGLRTEITVLGTNGNLDGSPLNLDNVCNKIVRVVLTRPEKILDIEMANEWYQNGINGNLKILTDMSTIFKNAGVVNILALSSGEGGMTFDDVRAGKMITAGATMQTIHMDRGQGDDGWRAIRQPWDWKDLPFAVSHNEPIGPRSSVNECTDALQLAMLRATGIVCGVGAFVLHNGSGVAGQVDPAHNRPANLWEVPGIDLVMQTVRNVDQGVPTAAADGSKFNWSWAGNPFPPVDGTMMWAGGANPQGCNRAYISTNPSGWACSLAGILKYVVMVAVSAGKISLFDPITALTTTMDVTAGQHVTINPASKDAAGYGAFIVRSL